MTIMLSIQLEMIFLPLTGISSLRSDIPTPPAAGLNTHHNISKKDSPRWNCSPFNAEILFLLLQDIHIRIHHQVEDNWFLSIRSNC